MSVDTISIEDEFQPSFNFGTDMPRAKLVTDKPRGRVGSYAFFVQTCREEHKKNHPKENVIFSEFSKKCAERWKTMSDAEKSPFHELANKDKARFDTEMSGYDGPQEKKSRKKQKKDPNAPKRALSAFFWYSSTERSKVKEEFPNYNVGEVAKELGKRWAAEPKEIRMKYDDMSKKDSARYAEEMKAWKNTELSVNAVTPGDGYASNVDMKDAAMKQEFPE